MPSEISMCIAADLMAEAAECLGAPNARESKSLMQELVFKTCVTRSPAEGKLEEVASFCMMRILAASELDASTGGW